MLNRHAKPQLSSPRKCPKCHGLIVPDVSYQHGQVVDAWKCVACGLTSESSGFYDAQKQDTVMR